MPSTSMRTTALSFAYDSVRVFSDVQLHLTPGWTGVVGGNGAGKSTLLRLLAGTLQPTAGAVIGVPDPLVVALCPQRVDTRTAAIDDFADDWSRAAIRARARLALSPDALERWSTLSPGERKRWQIGAALHRRPELLLLDEPTNHLDVDGRRALLDALRRFNGIGVLVSHDRALLDQLTTGTIRLEQGRATHFDAPYTAARAQWERSAQARQAEVDALSAARRRARAQLADERRARQRADAALSSRNRMRSSSDHDARGAGAKARARAAAAKVGRRVGVVRRAHAQLATEIAALKPPPAEFGRALTVTAAGERRRVLAQIDGDVRVGDRTLLRGAQAVVERDSRVWLQGANGSGKTSILRALLRRCVLAPDRVLALAQDPDPRVWRARLEALDSADRGIVLNGVAALGVPPDRLLRSQAHSPGETQKLALAFGLTRPTALLALDEPTNHLDAPAIERLQTALAAWPGALVLITHDERLARACTTVVWQLSGGRLSVAHPTR